MNPTRLSRAWIIVLAFLATLTSLSAQAPTPRPTPRPSPTPRPYFIPHLINYQGRVLTNGVNFDGAGQFKFALVDGITGLTHWSNDGTSTAGSQPTAAVTLTVTKGLYSVHLGDTSLANMTTIPASVFTNTDVRLRVWFNDGTNGSQLLTPDQRVTAVGFAMMAESVMEGAITSSKIANGAVGSAQIANGAVGTGQLATNAVQSGNIANGAIGNDQLASGAAAANLNAISQTAVASGGVVLSVTENTALAAAGYVKIGTIQGNDAWQQSKTDNTPPAGTYQSVWTGSEMIVWGARTNLAPIAVAGRYNPATNVWSDVASAGAPSPRTYNACIWTGSEMIIWGGSGSAHVNDGGRYNPASNTWTPMTATGAPSGRVSFTGVWTGTEMIVWGGFNAGHLNNGARYKPANNTWTAVAMSGAPSARRDHVAVWTGQEMIIWGGYAGAGPYFAFNDGGRYNPLTDTWGTMDSTGAPLARTGHRAVWTGSEMIVWGGSSVNDPYTTYNNGGRYNPTTNVWAGIAATGASDSRFAHTLVWTGSEMIVWGGLGGGTNNFLNEGKRYNPSSNTWAAVNGIGAPSPRAEHVAVWTGSEMIVWGGGNLNDGGRYNSASNTWTTITSGAPVSRSGQSTVWTGSEMIVFGGAISPFSKYCGDGGRFDPATNVWKPLSPTGAPSSRGMHTAIWTGSEMIIWGGYNTANSVATILGDGARYQLLTDTWSPMSADGAPTARWNHGAVWTGNQMIIWGGSSNGNPAAAQASYNPSSDTWSPISTTNAAFSEHGRSLIWTGSEMMVFGGGPGSAGGRYNPNSNSWTSISNVNAPPLDRTDYTAIWTGSEMVIWGGKSLYQAHYNDGGRYSPSSNTWASISAVGAPSHRFKHSAVWTGREMVVWGGGGDPTHYGSQATQYFKDGARYNPTANTWTSVSAVGTRFARMDHSAVWTGSEMLVWGGFNGYGLNNVERYNPVSDAWAAAEPGGRTAHSAVWTGSEMIVWGGFNGVFLNDGGRFDPASNSWKATSTVGAPTGRYHHTAVWTGSQMVVWGGWGDASLYLNSGGRYNPMTNAWSPVSSVGAPAGRNTHRAVWTGSQMIVWGGAGNSGDLNDGGRYDPGADSWTNVSTTNAPSARYAHSMIWTGDEMMVWGGGLGAGPLNDGGRYNPVSDAWTPISAVGAPSGRLHHTAVWTGSEMLLWGGFNTTALGDGSRYSPTTDSWTPMGGLHAPTARTAQTAVWTGSEMVVWGGTDGARSLNDGARYNPANNSWLTMTTMGAPSARFEHTAVWTGEKMFVWGGLGSLSASVYPAGAFSYSLSHPMYLYQRP